MFFLTKSSYRKSENICSDNYNYILKFWWLHYINSSNIWKPLKPLVYLYLLRLVIFFNFLICKLRNLSYFAKFTSYSPLTFTFDIFICIYIVLSKLFVNISIFMQKSVWSATDRSILKTDGVSVHDPLGPRSHCTTKRKRDLVFLAQGSV